MGLDLSLKESSTPPVQGQEGSLKRGNTLLGDPNQQAKRPAAITANPQGAETEISQQKRRFIGDDNPQKAKRPTLLERNATITGPPP